MSSLIVVHPRFDGVWPLQPINSTHCGKNREQSNSYASNPATSETSARLPHIPPESNGSRVLVYP